MATVQCLRPPSVFISADWKSQIVDPDIIRKLLLQLADYTDILLQFCDVLEVVSVDSAMLSSVLKLNLVLPHSTCVNVGLWNTDQNFIDSKPAIEGGGFYMVPSCSEGYYKWRFFSHYEEFYQVNEENTQVLT